MGHLFAKPLLKIPFCRFKRHTCPPPRFRLALPPPDLASAGFAVGEERTCPAGIQPFRNQKQGYIFRLIYWFSYFYCENPSRKKPIEEQWQLHYSLFYNKLHIDIEYWYGMCSAFPRWENVRAFLKIYWYILLFTFPSSTFFERIRFHAGQNAGQNRAGRISFLQEESGLLCSYL